MFSDKLVYLVTSSRNIWSASTNQKVIGPPYSIIALDIKTGNQVWKLSFGQGFSPLTKIIGDQIYIQTSQPEGWGDDYHELNELLVVNKNTSEMLWQFNENYPHGEIEHLFHDNVVYIGTEDGFIFALDSITGKTIWQTITLFPHYLLVEEILLSLRIIRINMLQLLHQQAHKNGF